MRSSMISLAVLGLSALAIADSTCFDINIIGADIHAAAGSNYTIDINIIGADITTEGTASNYTIKIPIGTSTTLKARANIPAVEDNHVDISDGFKNRKREDDNIEIADGFKTRKRDEDNVEIADGFRTRKRDEDNVEIADGF